MIISIDTEEAFDKIQHLLIIKTFQKWALEEPTQHSKDYV